MCAAFGNKDTMLSASAEQLRDSPDNYRHASEAIISILRRSASRRQRQQESDGVIGGRITMESCYGIENTSPCPERGDGCILYLSRTNTTMPDIKVCIPQYTTSTTICQRGEKALKSNYSGRLYLIQGGTENATNRNTLKRLKKISSKNVVAKRMDAKIALQQARNREQTSTSSSSSSSSSSFNDDNEW